MQRPLVLGVAVFLCPADVAQFGVVEAASLSGFLQLQGVQALDGTSERNLAIKHYEHERLILRSLQGDTSER